MQNDEIKEILDKLLDYITNLQQENKTQHENNQNMQEEMARVWEENERLKEKIDQLTNNWNELEEYIVKNKDYYGGITSEDILDKMKEIKEGNNE